MNKFFKYRTFIYTSLERVGPTSRLVSDNIGIQEGLEKYWSP